MNWLRSCMQLMIQQPRQRSVRCRFFWPKLEWLEHRLPPAAHDTLSSALPLSFAASPVAQVSDTLTTANQVKLYRVDVTSDTFLLATATPVASPGFEPRLTLYDASSRLLIQSDQH